MQGKEQNGSYPLTLTDSLHNSIRAWTLSTLAMGWLTIVATLLLGRLTAQDTRWDAPIRTMESSETNISFVHSDGSSGKHYIMETVIGSLAILDFDADGLHDIFFVNGCPLPGSDEKTGNGSRLYKNLGNMRFEDVTERAGLVARGYGMGVVVGDIDNDGWCDFFLSEFGGAQLFMNCGDGTFQQRESEFGLACLDRFGAGNSLIDIDLDGNLDLYCANYVDFAWDQHQVRTISGHEFSLGPNDFKPSRHYLFRNSGDRSFLDVSDRSGISSFRAPGMGVISADFDEDGDMDLFVANDQKPNFLWLNDGGGRFEESAVLAGVAYDRNGRANGNMGVEYADMNGDGRLDFLTTTYQDEMPVYYQALGGGLYADRTNVARIDPTLNAHVTWGIGAIDFDNDADKDLFFACGHFLANLRYIDDRTSVKVTNYMLANDGKGRFTNVTKRAGSALQVVESSRGSAFEDFDNDGDIDMVVLNVNASPTVGRNELQTSANSVCITLRGIQSNRDGVGSYVVVRDTMGREQKQAVIAGRGYESSFGSRLHFGLGDASLHSVEVRWPSGLRETFFNQDRQILLVEGSGKQLVNR